MKKWIKRMLIALLAAVMLTFVGVQVYMVFFNNYRTQVATSWVMGNSVTTKGLLIRDEEVIQAQHSGYYDYTIENGSKISGGEEIAKVYQSADDLLKMKQIEQLTETQRILSSVSAGNITNPDTLNNQIYTLICQMNKNFSLGDFSSMTTYKTGLLAYICRREASVGEEISFDEEVASIQSQIDQLQSSVGSYSVENAVQSGYFVSGTDGYESTLTPDSLDSLTIDTVNEILSLEHIETEENSFGKVVTDFDWYVAIVVNQKDPAWLAEGKTVSVSFNGLMENSIQATVQRQSTQGDKCLVILRCSVINSDLVGLRTQSVTVSSANQSGIRVPADAVHIVDGQKGVYVLSNSKAVFKKIEVMVDTGEDLLCKVVSGEDNADYLQIYDEIIVSGRDLYNGKQIK